MASFLVDAPFFNACLCKNCSFNNILLILILQDFLVFQGLNNLLEIF